MNFSNDLLHLSLALLKSCKTLSHLNQILALTTKSALQTDPVVVGKLLLVSAISLPNAFDHAFRLFSYFPTPDTFMCNTLIRGFSQSPDPRHAVLVFAKMRSDRLPFDSFTFAFALKAAANSKSVLSGTQIHGGCLRVGLQSHLFVGTTLVSFYAECGCLPDARKVFEGIPQPNVVAWNALLTACFRADDLEDANEVFAEMPFRNQTSWNVVLAGYAKAGEMGQARRIFREMEQKDPVSWSTMITGFARIGWFDDTFGFFRELLRSEFPPNEVSLTGVLSSCAQSGAFEFGRMVHCYVEKTGFLRISSVANALLDTYMKCGNVSMAQRVFDRCMETKCIVSWTSMIAGLAMHGLGREAIEVFRQMEGKGIKADGVTFISLLYACSHSGLVFEGCNYFSKMEDIYGIETSIEHYGCMVDLYGRAGRLEEAYDFIKQMPIKPNAIIWRTLLGACSIHGCVGLAEQVKEHLSQLDPNESSDYVLLSNIYAVAGQWKDAADVRSSMSLQRIRKTPGWSAIEVDKTIHLFVANDEPNGLKEEAYLKLKEIMTRLRKEGYSPETASVLHDIEEEEKEDAISRHSEKLAVAFGIARIVSGGVIRIVKNLRVCRDCHGVMKLISKVYGREIVVRDRSRFHLFKDGLCSCRDYW